MSKVHYYDNSILKDAPWYLKIYYDNNNEYGAICGYVRRNITLDKSKVTCFWCKQALKRKKASLPPVEQAH